MHRQMNALLSLSLVFGALLLAWTVPAQPQTSLAPPQSPAAPPSAAQQLRVTEPEPKESLLTPSRPTPEGDVPLLRRFIPGLAEGMAQLPPFLRDTSLTLDLRTFYFNRLNSNATQNEAWAFGGRLAYQSGWLWDTLAVGAVGYSSQPLYAPEDTPGTLLLKPPQDSITVLGQAYAQLRYKEYALLTGYRQLVDEDYVNPQDNRMIPNTFEGVTVTGKLGPVDYYVGYLTAIKQRQDDRFQNMASAAGVATGENRGLVLTRFSGEPLPGLTLYGANYLVPDVFNTAYGNAEWTHKLTADLSFQIGIQYTDQRSVGEALLGNFSTWNVSTRGLVFWRGLTAGAAFSATGDESKILTPYGTYPGYLNFQERDFDRANEKAWGAGVGYDFGAGTMLPGVRIPGLSVLVRYADGRDAENPSTSSGLPKVREGDFDVTWNIPWVRGLQFRFRNAYVAESGERVLKAFRIILNYEIPLL